tara:strand:+ start:79 stop:327 length:249 start_codon:yes stop_codon:yes gene_type:complete
LDVLIIKKKTMFKKLKLWFQGLFIKQIFTSKKFIYTLIGILTTLLSKQFGLNPEEVNNILISIAALVLGQGLADFGKESKKK